MSREIPGYVIPKSRTVGVVFYQYADEPSAAHIEIRSPFTFCATIGLSAGESFSYISFGSAGAANMNATIMA
jgi:hypothetical protein